MKSSVNLVVWLTKRVDEEANLPAVKTEPLAVPKMEMTTPSGTRNAAGPSTILAQSYHHNQTQILRQSVHFDEDWHTTATVLEFSITGTVKTVK